VLRESPVRAWTCFRRRMESLAWFASFMSGTFSLLMEHD
jgi:hypothetical protein